MKQNIHNRKYLEEKRKALRNNSTVAEASLWRSIKKSQLANRKFRRQHSIENFIVDFYCPKEKLIVELDGAYHFNFAQQNYDQERTLRLNALGFKVIRFENKLVFEDLNGVLGEIMSHFKS